MRSDVVSYLFCGFTLDCELFELRFEQEPVELLPQAFDVLAYLIRNRDRFVSKEELVEQVWEARAVGSSSVPTAINAIRKALRDRADEARFVQTAYRRGYRFIAEVREVRRRQRPEPGPEFVGREEELGLLSSALERAEARRTPQLVLVGGDPGIGKTRLCEEFAWAVASSGRGDMLVGRSLEEEGAPAFWPWCQVVRQLAELGDTAETERILAPDASVLADMIPDIATWLPLTGAAPPLEAAQARFRLFQAMTRTLERAAARAPLVFVLDDLHRADRDTLALLSFVLGEAREAPLLVVGALRDVELARDPQAEQLVTAMLARDDSVAVSLRGLSAEATARLLADAVPGLPQGLAAKIHEHTGGNPFFAGQLARLVAARGVEEAVSSWTAPEGVRSVIERQVDVLPPETVRILEAASVAGREFAGGVIAAAVGTTAGALAQALEPAVEARLLHRGQATHAYRFVHVLVRDCIYEGLGVELRASLHHRFAEALEHAHTSHIEPFAAQLAHHFSRADPEVGNEKAVRYATRAGRWATARLAHQDAASQFRHALQCLEARPAPDPRARARLLLELGEAEIRAGNRETGASQLREVVVLARHLEEPILLAQAALALSPGFFSIEFGVVDLPLIQLLEEALAALGHRDRTLRARLLARLALALNNSADDERRRTLCDDAIALAEDAGNDAALAYALHARHAVLWDPDNVEERLRLATQVILLSSKSGDRETELVHRLFRITERLELADISAFDSELAVFARMADSLQHANALWYVRLLRATRAILKGRFSEGDRLALESFRMGTRIADKNAFLSFGIQTGYLRLERDQFDGFSDEIEHVIEDFPPLEKTWRSALAWALAEVGDLQTCIEQYDRVIHGGLGRIPRDVLWMTSMSFLPTVALQIGDLAALQWLRNALTPFAERVGVVGYSALCLGSVSRPLGLACAGVGDLEMAERHLRRALAVNTRLGAVPWVARTMVELADVLERRGCSGARAEAATLRDRALEVARNRGLRTLEQRAGRAPSF